MEIGALQSIPLNQIQPSPHQARKAFDEESLKGLAASMKEEGLIQPITVRKVNSEQATGNSNVVPVNRSLLPVYQLISGERRLRAAKLLGWPEITARVITVDNEAEAAVKGLIENLQREDLNPIEEAEGFEVLQKMDRAHWTHERISQTVGKSRAYVTQSLGLQKLPEAVQTNVRHLTLSRSHAVELCRLRNAEEQLEVALQIKDRLTVMETRQLIDSILNTKHKAKMRKAPLREVPMKDPLAEEWPGLMMNPEVAKPGTWRVTYGLQKLFEKAGIYMPGWEFKVVPPGAHPKAELVQWLRRLADALAGDSKPAKAPVTPEVEPQRSPPPDWVPKTKDEAKQAAKDSKNLRLPANAQEQAELEALAAQGPRAVYTWIYGPENIMTRMVESKSWKDLGMDDPIEGCRELVQALRE